jgi:hypothetical protein
MRITAQLAHITEIYRTFFAHFHKTHRSFTAQYAFLSKCDTAQFAFLPHLNVSSASMLPLIQILTWFRFIWTCYRFIKKDRTQFIDGGRWRESNSDDWIVFPARTLPYSMTQLWSAVLHCNLRVTISVTNRYYFSLPFYHDTATSHEHSLFFSHISMNACTMERNRKRVVWPNFKAAFITFWVNSEVHSSSMMKLQRCNTSQFAEH